MFWISLTCVLLAAFDGTVPDVGVAHPTTKRGPAVGDLTLVERSGPAPGQGERPRLPDPDLEPGFPVQAWHGSGNYHAGPAIHTMVGNLDEDPQLEVVATALANGPLYAWNHDGTPVPGWPVSSLAGAAYPVLGQLDPASSGLEVFAAFYGPGLGAWSASGSTLPGWPRPSANYVATPPSAGDVDGDGIDEVFLEEEDWKLHAYRADGTILPGWPAYQGVGGQERHTPALADLDGDEDLEIITVSGTSNSVASLLAYHHGGAAVAGFPVSLSWGKTDTFPAVGDVDGDGAPEIVVVMSEEGYPFRPFVRILGAGGTTERTLIAAGDVSYGSAPALADLDGDGVPEIVVQTEDALNVWKGDGTVVSGWPQVWGSGYWLGNSAPVVGDVTGDGEPDIVIVTQVAGSSENGEVLVYDRHGALHPRFPKPLPLGAGAVPAIADLDLDGRNEIIVTGAFWNGYSGNYDKLWVFDLGGSTHGPVHWGQFMGGPRHRGTYGSEGDIIFRNGFELRTGA